MPAGLRCVRSFALPSHCAAGPASEPEQTIPNGFPSLSLLMHPVDETLKNVKSIAAIINEGQNVGIRDHKRDGGDRLL